MLYLAGLTAEFAVLVALLAVAAQRGATVTAGVLILVRYIAIAVLGFFVAAVARRWSLKRLLVASTLLRAAVLALVGLLLIIKSPNILIYIGFVVEIAAGIALRPATSGLIHSLQGSEVEASASNHVRDLMLAVSLVLGPLAAALLLSVSSPQSILFAAAIVLLVSAWFAHRVSQALSAVNAPAEQLGRAIQSGLKALGQNRSVWLLLILAFSQFVTVGAVYVFSLPVALTVLHSQLFTIGILIGSFGIGMLFSAIVTPSTQASRRLHLWAWFGLLLCGLALVAIGLSSSYAIAITMLALIGCASGLWSSCFFSLLKRVLAKSTLTNILHVLEGLILAGLGSGAVLVPVLLQLTTISTALIVVGCICPSIATLSLPLLRRTVNRLNDRDDRLAWLQRVHILSWLPPTSMEELALKMRPLTMRGGEEVIRQGEKGYAFYIIRDGVAEVLGHGERVATLTSGDYFGEIALMRDIPRTATIRASTDLSLWVIFASDFRTVVAAYRESLTETESAIANRLATFRPSGISI